MPLTMTILREGCGLTQDALADLVASINRRAREGDPVPVLGLDGNPAHLIIRAWLDGGSLRAEVRFQAEGQ